MRRQAVIVDTNVVVAGLLTGNTASPVARILDGMLTGAIAYALSEALLAEYRAVLVRPQLRKLHGLSVTEIDTFLTDIAFNAIVLAPAPAQPAPDPGDQLLWELLAARPDLLLVTGDKLLQRDPGMSGRVIEPAAFAATF